MTAGKFAIALRLSCLLLVALSHAQNAPPVTPLAQAAAEATNFGEAGSEASSADYAASLVGASATEKAHNIGILIGIIFGSVAINIVTVFLIIFCLRGSRFAKSPPAEIEPRPSQRMSQRRSERKSRYDEIKDKYGLSGADKYPRVSSVQTSQSTERLLQDEPRESSRAMSERKKSSRATRGSFAEGEEERRSTALSRHSQLDDEEGEEEEEGEGKKSSIFSRLSSQIKDRVSSAIGDEGRKSSGRGSQRATSYADDERRSTARSSARATEDRRSTARSSQRGTEAEDRRSTARSSQRATDYADDERRSSARASQRATDYPEDDRRSSARPSFEERRSTARSSQRPTEAEERRSTARQTADDRYADEGPYPTESEQMRRSSAGRRSYR